MCLYLHFWTHLNVVMIPLWVPLTDFNGLSHQSSFMSELASCPYFPFILLRCFPLSTETFWRSLIWCHQFFPSVCRTHDRRWTREIDSQIKSFFPNRRKLFSVGVQSDAALLLTNEPVDLTQEENSWSSLTAHRWLFAGLSQPETLPSLGTFTQTSTPQHTSSS